MRYASRHPLVESRKGLTLTEIAIVFSIVGIVFAAIWTALAPVRSKALTDIAADQLSIVLTNTRNFYSSQQVAGSTGCYSTVNVSTGVFPTEMLNGTVANDVWNLRSTSATASVFLCGNNPVQAMIRYKFVPKKACIDLLISTSAQFSDANLMRIDVNGSTVTSGTQISPVSVSTAESVCNSSAQIDWYFRLRG